MARRPTSEARRIDEALKALEPPIRDAFLAAIYQARGAVDFPALLAALEAGDLGRAIDLLRVRETLLWPLVEAQRGSFMAGGAMVAASLPAVVAANWGFDGRAVRAEAWVSRAAGELIEAITDEPLQGIREALRAGLEAGRNPRAVALDVVGRIDPISKRRTGGLVGLNSQQTEWAIRARAELASGDPAQLTHYLTRKRRDKRFDAVVNRAIRDGKPLAAADVDRIAGRYKDRLLALRGETIARTEAINGLRAGRREGFQQLVDSGKVRADQITRSWDATLDSRTRPDHVAMDGQRRGMNEAFVAPDGSRLMYPGDTSLGASAAQTVACRCFERVRVDYLGG